MYWLSNSHMYIILLLTLALMPLNWGIECYKWKLITTNTEAISYKAAVKSVFSGICVGNLAPGRAMEFLAKIMFFQPQNRPTVTILHFINGMFQMLITVIAGICAIAYKVAQNQSSSILIYWVIAGGVLLILFFCWAILNVSFIQKKLGFIKWFRNHEAGNIIFSKQLIVTLLLLSVIRYCVFTLQFYLIYQTMTNTEKAFLPVFTSIAAYFMLTSIIPMISFIEPAIRAAIALFVFAQTADNSVNVVLSSTFMWLINVVVPSVIGYIIILKEKINFRPKFAD